jgi:DNA-binding PadR family transcriptional regulator
MSNDDISTLLHEFTDQTERQPDRPPAQMPTNEAPDTGRPDDSHSSGVRLDRSFASEYLDELIIAILFRCDEANGMDIIREFTHLFGVQFSPGTVYPHLHSLEEEGVLACRERVQTKEYHIDDEEAGREYIRSVLSQMTCLRDFLGTIPQESEQR